MVNWKQSPRWGKYAAMDHNERWHWHENEPVMELGRVSKGWVSTGQCLEADIKAIAPDWEQSVERRR